MIDINTIQSELDEIFNTGNYNDPEVLKVVQRGYAVSIPKKAKVLFIGFNPSEDKEMKKSFTYLIEKTNNGNKQYFKKFETLASKIGLDDWAYLDTFVYRETNQKAIHTILASPEGLNFLVKQLVITQKMIEEIQPELIVVCSGGARKFFGVDKEPVDEPTNNIWMGYNCDFSDRFGVHVIRDLHPESILGHAKSTNLKGVPILFTSNLKYMDSSNMERLVWQANRIHANYALFFRKNSGELDKAKVQFDKIEALVKRINEVQYQKIQLAQEGKYEIAGKLRDEELAKLNELVGQLEGVLV